MTGGAPIPVNDPHTFLGFIVHTWWWFIEVFHDLERSLPLEIC